MCGSPGGLPTGSCQPEPLGPDLAGPQAGAAGWATGLGRPWHATTYCPQVARLALQLLPDLALASAVGLLAAATTTVECAPIRSALVGLEGQSTLSTGLELDLHAATIAFVCNEVKRYGRYGCYGCYRQRAKTLRSTGEFLQVLSGIPQ